MFVFNFGFIGRLYSVIVALPGHLYYFSFALTFKLSAAVVWQFLGLTVQE